MFQNRDIDREFTKTTNAFRFLGIVAVLSVLSYVVLITFGCWVVYVLLRYFGVV